jgi:hypothetical protein
MDLFKRAKKRLLDFANLRRQNSQISDQINQPSVSSPALKRFRQFVESKNSQQQQQLGSGVTTRSKLKEKGPTSEENDFEIIEQEIEPEKSVAENSPNENQTGSPGAYESVPESPANESQAEENPQHILFDHETLVSENSLLQAYVVKTLFKRQKRFAFDDHQVNNSFPTTYLNNIFPYFLFKERHNLSPNSGLSWEHI